MGLGTDAAARPAACRELPGKVCQALQQAGMGGVAYEGSFLVLALREEAAAMLCAGAVASGGEPGFHGGLSMLSLHPALCPHLEVPVPPCPGCSGAPGHSVQGYSGENSRPSPSPLGAPSCLHQTDSWGAEQAVGWEPGELGRLGAAHLCFSLRGLQGWRAWWVPTPGVWLQTASALGRIQRTSRRGRCSL